MRTNSRRQFTCKTERVTDFQWNKVADILNTNRLNLEIQFPLGVKEISIGWCENFIATPEM